MSSPTLDINECHLCGKQVSKLIKSHIIPSFVGKWLKETSVTGYLRQGENANVRVQDLVKQKLLCSDCETALSVNEKLFAESIFIPFSQYFGSIIGRDKVKNHKPDPESLILAIGELNANTESTYMIGDSSADIQAANTIGITCILYYPKSHRQFYEYTRNEIEGLKASYVIATLSELVNLVSKQE